MANSVVVVTRPATVAVAGQGAQGVPGVQGAQGIQGIQGIPGDIASTAALKPGIDIRFVDGATGNDSYDGKSWGSAKRTVNAGYDAIDINGGVLYVTGRPFFGTTATDGLWLRGDGNDSLTGTNPLWRRAKQVTIVGEKGAYTGGNGLTPLTYIQGGHTTDPTRPALWLSGTGGAVKFENILVNAATALAMGFDSGDTTMTHAGTITAPHVFDSCYFQSTQLGGGPPVKINSNVFWLWFDKCAANSDMSFVDYTSDNRACFLIKDFSGGTADTAWLLHFKDTILTRGGIIYYAGGTSPLDLSIYDLSQDGGAGPSLPPAVWIKNFKGSLGRPGEIHKISAYDDHSLLGVVRIEGASDPSQINASGVNGAYQGEPRVVGPATVLTAGPSDGSNPVTHDQINVAVNGTRLIAARTDAGKQQFGARTVKAANLVNWDGATNWFLNGGVVKTNVQGPRGTPATGALRFTFASNGQHADPYNPASAGLAVANGDIIVCGAWVKFNPTDYSSGVPIGWSIPDGKTATRRTIVYQDGSNAGAGRPLRLWKNDGDWLWCVDWFTIPVATTFRFTITGKSASPVDVYGPMLLRFAAGAITEGEAAELADTLYEWPSTATVGDCISLPGQKLVASGGLGVGNSAAATTPGSVVKKMQVFDATGASLGYVPIYDAIT